MQECRHSMIFESFLFIWKYVKIRTPGGRRESAEGRKTPYSTSLLGFDQEALHLLPFCPRPYKMCCRSLLKKPLTESTVLLSLPLPPSTLVLHAGSLGFFSTEWALVLTSLLSTCLFNKHYLPNPLIFSFHNLTTSNSSYWKDMEV